MGNLTDLEICKRIAEIENLMFCTGGRYKRIEIWKNGKVFKYEKYNPLTDDALCFKLMVKYKVLITWQEFNDNCTAVIDGTSEDVPFPFAVADINNDNPNKAICLAIIEAYNG